MNKSKVVFFIVGILSLVQFTAYAQYTVKGKVTDSKTGEGLPFVNVYFQGSTTGTTTDFEGYYSITSNTKYDSVKATYIGYDERIKPISSAREQILNFQLVESITQLEEVVILPGENPAWPIMRKVVENKDSNNKINLTAYQYESYNKIEVDINNISEKFKNRKLFKDIVQIFDSLESVAGEDGEAILPLFLSESISDVYYRKDPKKNREVIKKNRFNGVGLEDAKIVNQLIGSTFQEYNFYNNYVTILNKQFISPISDSWKLFYMYLLTDSMMVDGEFCYKMEVDPKVSTDLAFYGTIWITKDDYALKQVDLNITKNANLNYVEDIKIQQQLIKTESGPWLPNKNRILMKVGNINDDWAGMLAKFYTSYENIIVDQPKDLEFFDEYYIIDETTNEDSEDYWKDVRHDPLTETEKYVYNMIDSMNSLPVVKTYVEIIEIFVNGYKNFGPWDFGPYIFSYANNSVEGNRMRVGFKTNYKLSEHWTFRGYLAYGGRDKVLKYSGSAEYLFNKRHWTRLRLQRTYDLFQVSVNPEDLTRNNLFLASTFWGKMRRAYYSEMNRFSFSSDITRGIRLGFGVQTRSFDPVFPFEYENDLGLTSQKFRTTEFNAQVRITKDEKWLLNNNGRISLGTKGWPIFTVNYTRGVNNLLQGDFDYDKLEVNIEKRFKLGFWGVSRYDISVGKIYSALPYPLLNAHLGNAGSPFYTVVAYNLMKRFEFVSDEWAGLRLVHSFQGNILNRVPLISKLKWRLIAHANVLYGNLSQQNVEFNPSNDPPYISDRIGFVPGVDGLDRNVPYVELGYGIENIFKVLRIDAFHRMTYLDKPNTPRFGVKFGVQFIL